MATPYFWEAGCFGNDPNIFPCSGWATLLSVFQCPLGADVVLGGYNVLSEF